MDKRIFPQKPSAAASQSGPPDSLAQPATFGAEPVPGEVAVADLNDLFAAAITRLAEWIARPSVEPDVMLACLQSLRQLHQTAASELLRRQQQLDGQP